MKCEWGYCPKKAVVRHTHKNSTGAVIWRASYCRGCAALDQGNSVVTGTRLHVQPMEVA